MNDLDERNIRFDNQVIRITYICHNPIKPDMKLYPLQVLFIFLLSVALKAQDYGGLRIPMCELADQPTISVSAMTVCQGDSVTLQIGMLDSLRDEATWSLFTDSCGGSAIQSNTAGLFHIVASKSTTYFIGGTGGCPAMSPCGSIAINVSNPTFSASTTNESGNGSGDGQIIVDAPSGGTPPYMFSYDNGVTYQSSNTFSSLPADDYPMRIKDSLGCESKSADQFNVYYSLENPAGISKIRSDLSQSSYCVFNIRNPNAIEVDEKNEKIYWGEEFYSDKVYVSNLDGSDTTKLYDLNASVYSLAIDTDNNRLYVGTSNEEIWVGNLDGSDTLTLLVPERGGDIEDMVLSKKYETLFFISDNDEKIWRVDTDGSNLLEVGSQLFDTGNPKSMTLDEKNGLLYIGNGNGDIVRFDIFGNNIEQIYNGGGFQIGEMEYDHRNDQLFLASTFNNILFTLHKDSMDLDTFVVSSAVSRGLALGRDGYYKICGPAPDLPGLSVSPSAQICPGSPVTISVSPSSQLNSAIEWVLYSEGCGINRIDANPMGEFNIISNKRQNYFVRGEGECLPLGECAMITVGDSIIPALTCTDDTLYIDESLLLSLTDLVPAANVVNNFNLTDILSNFNSVSDVLSTNIPNQYIFELDDGNENRIRDGGDDMYDRGNYLNTNFKTEFDYTDGAIVSDSSFGISGQYFTQYSDGIFFMAADMDMVDSFYISGGLGADSEGSVSGLALEMSCNETTYYGYVKRVDDGYLGDDDPTVNHMFIVPDYALAQHFYATDTDDDFDLLSNLSGASRLFYFLYSSRGGSHVITDDETEIIFQQAIQHIICRSTIPDNCGTALLSSSDLNLTCNDVGSNTQIEIIATDEAGNQASCQSNIVVLDTIKPTIVCRSDTIVQNDSNQCGAVVNYDVLIPFINKRWADSVIDFSSEYSETSWSANQVLGPPNVFPAYGDIGQAWAAETSDGQREFLELYYSHAVAVEQINIYETYNPGAVDSIYLRDVSSGNWHLVWSDSAQAPDPPDVSRIFTIDIPRTNYLVDAIRIAVNSPAISSWNEIDAVQLAATDTLIQNYIVSENCSAMPVTQISGLTSGAFFPLGTTTNTFVVHDGSGNSDTCSFDVVVTNADSTCCSQFLEISDRPMAPGLYLTGTFIRSDGLVAQPSAVEFRARNFIDLNPAFEVELGAEFLGVIDDCFNNPEPVPKE